MLRELKAKVDELCERDPQAALALVRRIQDKLQPGFPFPPEARLSLSSITGWFRTSST